MWPLPRCASEWRSRGPVGRGRRAWRRRPPLGSWRRFPPFRRSASSRRRPGRRSASGCRRRCRSAQTPQRRSLRESRHASTKLCKNKPEGKSEAGDRRLVSGSSFEFLYVSLSMCRQRWHTAHQCPPTGQACRWSRHLKRLIRPFYHSCPLPLAVLDSGLYDLPPWTPTLWLWFGARQKCRLSILHSKKKRGGGGNQPHNYPKSDTQVGGADGTKERVPDCLTHVGGFDLQLGWSFVVVGKRQRALFDSVEQLGDGVFPTFLFHSVPGHQLILLHQVVHGVH